MVIFEQNIEVDNPVSIRESEYSPGYSLSKPQIPMNTQIYYDESPHNGSLYQCYVTGTTRFYHGHHFIMGV